MRERSRWQGMMTIVQLNWPFYASAAAVMVGSACGIWRFAMPEMRLVCSFAIAGSTYFLLTSLAVSHLVYDRSDLYRWHWLDRALQGTTQGRMIFCHSGFDETSRALRARLRNVDWVILDHYDERRMTERSIRRARRMFPPVAGTLPAAFDRWPMAAEGANVVFGLLAIHELRSEAERSAWFAEARRCLTKDGRIVLAEHTRDFPNFLAFGPGFLHFHSPASWRRCWESNGLRAVDEFHVTPWVRVFVLGVS